MIAMKYGTQFIKTHQLLIWRLKIFCIDFVHQKLLILTNICWSYLKILQMRVQFF